MNLASDKLFIYSMTSKLLTMKNKIPSQNEGKSLDYFKSIHFTSQKQASVLFERAKDRLFDVNHWNELTNTSYAVFTIVDTSGFMLDRIVQTDDFIRIDIPGPGLPSADGYDWVQVEQIDKKQEGKNRQISLTLRPCPNPTRENSDIAHFFTRIASSSLLLQQKSTHIFVHYSGRNEVINSDNESVLDTFKNISVDLAAKMEASFPQWKALIKGLASLHSTE